MSIQGSGGFGGNSLSSCGRRHPQDSQASLTFPEDCPTAGHVVDLIITDERRIQVLDTPRMMTLHDDVMRTIVEIPESQLKSLDRLCRRDRISRAEAIRRAVARMVNEQRPMEDGMSGAFGIWKHRAGDVRSLRTQLRGEWR
mgnify:CR=1 FL=1